MPVSIGVRAPEADLAIVEVSGQIKLGSGHSELEKRVGSLLLEKRKRIIFDLTAVEYIDSAGAGSLAECAYKAAMAGGNFRIAGSSPKVQKIIDTVGLNLVIDCFPSVDDALRNFPVRQPGDKLRW